MGQIHYGPGSADLTVNIDDVWLHVIEHLILERFVRGERAGKPFALVLAGIDGKTQRSVYVSQGVPLTISYGRRVAPDEITDDMKAYAKQARADLEETGLLAVPGTSAEV